MRKDRWIVGSVDEAGLMASRALRDSSRALLEEGRING